MHSPIAPQPKRRKRLPASLLCLLASAFGFVLPLHSAPAQAGEGKLAPKPLYRDPIYDGAADPTLIWDKLEKKWLMFYTDRRANVPGLEGVIWLHKTPVNIAVSSDGGATWTYRGTLKVPYGKPDYTYWAPEIVSDGALYHMFLTVVPGTFRDWNAPREIIHLTSPNLKDWTFISSLPLASDRVIDPCVFHLPNGTWRLWYKNERDHSHIYYSDSPDLTHWSGGGPTITDRSGEGPIVFRWKDRYWMVTDVWHGLGVYSSQDATQWTAQPNNLLERPGVIPTDRSQGHHADVIVSGGRAFLFYFVHQKDADLQPNLLNSARRTVLQVTELHLANGQLTCDRNQPTHILLLPPQ